MRVNSQWCFYPFILNKSLFWCHHPKTSKINKSQSFVYGVVSTLDTTLSIIWIFLLMFKFTFSVVFSDQSWYPLILFFFSLSIFTTFGNAFLIVSSSLIAWIKWAFNGESTLKPKILIFLDLMSFRIWVGPILIGYYE